MRLPRHVLVPLLVLLAPGCGAARPDDAPPASSAPAAGAPADGSPAFAGRRAWSFEDAQAGGLPAGWRAASTNGKGPPARWSVVDEGAHAGKRALALLDAREASGQTYNLCWTDEILFLNGRVSVAVHAGSGAEDQGGGPAWRVRGPDDYYLARWNPLEDNFRVYSVRGGRRTELDSADVRADPSRWHTIDVRQEGALITCSFDGRELLRVSDTAHLAPGGVGLWTKADAESAFDDLAVESP